MADNKSFPEQERDWNFGEAVRGQRDWREMRAGGKGVDGWVMRHLGPCEDLGFNFVYVGKPL